MKALADDKIVATQKLKFVLRQAENILGKGENAGNQHFLLLHKVFSKATFFRVVKVGIAWRIVKTNQAIQ